MRPENQAAGVSVNTLRSRKRYAVLHLRERLRSIYGPFATNPTVENPLDLTWEVSDRPENF